MTSDTNVNSHISLISAKNNALKNQTKNRPYHSLQLILFNANSSNLQKKPDENKRIIRCCSSSLKIPAEMCGLQRQQCESGVCESTEM